MNLSDAWLGPQLGNLEAINTTGRLTMSLRPAEPDGVLSRIQTSDALSFIRSRSTIILNGEFDFLTPPRSMIPCGSKFPTAHSSSFPRAFHAFT